MVATSSSRAGAVGFLFSAVLATALLSPSIPAVDARVLTQFGSFKIPKPWDSDNIKDKVEDGVQKVKDEAEKEKYDGDKYPGQNKGDSGDACDQGDNCFSRKCRKGKCVQDDNMDSRNFRCGKDQHWEDGRCRRDGSSNYNDEDIKAAKSMAKKMKNNMKVKNPFG